MTTVAVAALLIAVATVLPYSFNFRAPPDAHEMTLVLAVSQSRFLEFLAKPEQVREDATAQRN